MPRVLTIEGGSHQSRTLPTSKTIIQYYEVLVALSAYIKIDVDISLPLLVRILDLRALHSFSSNMCNWVYARSIRLLRSLENPHAKVKVVDRAVHSAAALELKVLPVHGYMWLLCRRI